VTIYPLPALRAVALHAQGLASPDAAAPGIGSIAAAIRQLGCLQIDTLQMVHRSHLLTLWSRLGTFDPADFDRLAYSPSDRRLFEGWQHAAAFIPLEDYRYQLPHQRRLREGPNDWYQRWLSQKTNAELVPTVLARIRQEGALRASDFGSDGHKRSGWWDWKPAKVALEYLYAFGDLMIANRVNFQRLYDLTQRVLPTWVDTTEPTSPERDRYWIEQGARALGVFDPLQAADYSYRKRTPTRPILQALLQNATLLPIQAELADGQVHEWLVHRDLLPLLQQAADGALTARRTTFLSPFDSLFWARGRDKQLWDFHQHLEAYTPAPKRQWGYFCLPILHGDRLVGRFDPKLERRTRVLRLKALYLQAGVAPDEELLHAVAAALADFMRFHNADTLVIERSQPAELGQRLLARL
jgi:uncharacterized protein YcaQ